MSTVGLITEYNPFHMGHEYHIEMAKKVTGADHAIVIMSGNYVQRGTPAFMDKHTRTRIALNHGADIVFELPVPYSCSSAELFALSAVTLLHKMGAIDYICFGCECDNPKLLNSISLVLADAKNDSTHMLNSIIKDYLKQGESYASARSLALCAYFEDRCNDTDIELIKDIISQPNNILAIEYLKSLQLLSSNIKPVPLKRTLASYHDNAKNDFMYSASSVRNIIFDVLSDRNGNDSDGFVFSSSEYVHKLSSFDSTYKDALFKTFPISEEDFNLILGEKLLSYRATTTNFADFAFVDSQLANRINNVLDNYPFNGWKKFTETVKTKNIAYTAVSRALLSLMLGLNKSCLEMYLSNNIASYVRLLGFKPSASPLLKRIKENGMLTIIGQLSEIKSSSLNDTDKQLLSHSIYCDELYNMVVRTKYNTEIPLEYRRKITV